MTSDELLFTYGSLRRPEVQLDTFGRLLRGETDVLTGYTLDHAEIHAHRLSSAAGSTVHAVLRPTGNPLDKVVGTAVVVTTEELDAADEYESTVFRRIPVTLASGRPAWVYTV
ncbi:gamma-glutamylcyclotransferase family protein [Microbacterium sp. No. 7]|uniref:gamma-glutamylcyclotransferase family protein n=1 Tax=Microbacterium sp. No. 7 TaxID=1714373 RepID=UPI0006D05FA3|nr:gamma-glutamylcyclotransferase family protein [Microbacterium sp. No. 7]ALJ19722.1 UDP-N-acetylmuramate--alanine ligase [Microbacterium sp. No. 7]